MIKLNDAIYNLLTSDTGLTEIVSNRVYPLILEQNTDLPAIVITRSSDNDYTNDGNYVFKSIINIAALSSTYNQSIDIAEKIDDIINFYKGEVSGINIVDCRLIDINEKYQDEAYVQELSYEMKNY